MNNFYSIDELKKMGFKYLGGNNILISRKASIYGIDNIIIGDNVRIDDFCILSGNIKIGNYVHISACVCMFAGETGIELSDFVSVSSRCAVYAKSDDYSGAVMSNPMVPIKYRHIMSGKVLFEKHTLIGTGSTILPGVTISEGTSIGSMSLVNRTLDPWGIYVGIPCKKIKNRKKDILELEKNFLNEINNNL